MGRRGPAPTPTPILKLRDSDLVNRRGPRGRRKEVQAPSGIPERPSWMDADADARAMWGELVPMLEGMGVLSRIDGNALARYCRLWSQWRKAEQWIDERGMCYPLKDESGAIKYVQQWPQVSIAAKLSAQLTRLEQEFGMTPSARTRIQASGDGSDQAAEARKLRFFEAG